MEATLVTKSTATQPTFAKSTWKCLRDTRITDPREDKARIERDKGGLLKHCYGWFVNNPFFRRWQAQGSPPTLWIRGDPGQGKTMMMIGLVEELESSHNSGLVAYFFCQSSRPDLNNAASVLRGLIYMLVVQRQKLLIPQVEERLEAAGQQLISDFNTFDTLRAILLDILYDASLPTIYLLVDALDECTYGLNDLVRIIEDEGLQQRPNVRWLLTTRDHPSTLSQHLSPPVVDVDMYVPYVTVAVWMFIDFKVGQLAIKNQYDAKTCTKLKQLLRYKAGTSFLWASLVCKELMDVPLHRTMEVVEAVSPGLDKLYNRMLAQVRAQDGRTAQYCKSILEAIALAFRPLQLEELVVVAGLSHFPSGDMDILRDLVGCCGPFLAVCDKTVSFVHPSARDYVISNIDQQSLEDTVVVEWHQQATDRLLNIMDRKLQRDICNLKMPGVGIEKTLSTIDRSILGEVAYACEHWVDHVKARVQNYRNIPLDGGKVCNFLHTHLLHWLEAMSLLQKMPEAVAALQRLQSLLSETLESMVLYEFVDDALQFTMQSILGIQETPLQVYDAAIVFAPKRNLVRRQFGQETSQWMKIKSGLDVDPLLETLEGHTGTITCMAFSLQGNLLASASYDMTVRIWDMKTAQLLRTLETHTSIVTSVAFFPLGDRLASGSSDEMIRVWHIATGQLLNTLNVHTNSECIMAFSPAGELLASAAKNNTVTLWNTMDAKLLHAHKLESYSGQVSSMAFSIQGDRLASGSYDEILQVWDTKTWQLLKTLEPHVGPIGSLAFSPEDDRLASGSFNGTVQVWDTKTWELLYTFVCYTNPISDTDPISPVNYVAFVAQGHHLASCTYTGRVCVFDVQNGKLLYTYMLGGHLRWIASMAFSAQGDRIASATSDKIVRIWDTVAMQSLYDHTFESHTQRVTSMAFSMQGDLLASASDDTTVRIWNAKTKESLGILRGHTQRVTSVAFSTQSDLLASSSDDTTVRIWNARTNESLRVLQGHTCCVTRVAFSSAGDGLVSASDDGTVRVWDANSGHLMRTMQSAGSTNRLIFSDDGLTLLTDHGHYSFTNPSSRLCVLTDPLLQSIQVKDGWVMIDSKRKVWLPADYQPSSTAVHGMMLALGLVSGKVILLHFFSVDSPFSRLE